jgi:hypothetical protein
MIYTVKNLMRDLRAGKYTSIGCYPTYFITSDGEALSHEAVRENLWCVARATHQWSKRRTYPSAWAVIGSEINWENPDLRCAHTGKRIESAYAEDAAPDTAPASSLGPVATAEIDKLLAWAHEQATCTECLICHDVLPTALDLTAHMARHARMATGDEDNRGGAPRP